MQVDYIYTGDALSVLRTFPDECVQMIMTSPPYWGLRDYGVEQIFGGDNCEHEWKQDIHQKQGNFCQKCGAWKGQLGLEPTPEMYIEHMVEIFSELQRVLKNDGTLWLNMGDTYSDSKCLTMIPERLAWSLIQNGWILRNKIIWHKPNAAPESVLDRFSNKWEYLFMFSKSRRYYFNLDAVRIPHKLQSIERYKRSYMGNHSKNKYTKISFKTPDSNRELNPLGKNPGDVFEISIQSSPETNFATFPQALCERPIKAGSKIGDVVLDPFCGTGTTLLVAKRHGREAVGIEINKEYVDIANKRIFGSLFNFKSGEKK